MTVPSENNSHIHDQFIWLSSAVPVRSRQIRYVVNAHLSQISIDALKNEESNGISGLFNTRCWKRWVAVALSAQRRYYPSVVYRESVLPVLRRTYTPPIDDSSHHAQSGYTTGHSCLVLGSGHPLPKARASLTRTRVKHECATRCHEPHLNLRHMNIAAYNPSGIAQNNGLS